MATLNPGPESLLPYFSPAFPDELLGSWLSRLVVLNGEPSFMAFAKNRGLAINAKSAVADPLNGANYVHAIALLFGLEHDDLMRVGTTKAFWDAFDRTGAKTLTEQSQRRVQARLSPPLLRLCPGCIEDDFREHGCAYFHRVHHLKSTVCPRHGLRLQDSCASCTRPLRSANEPTIIPTRCECGIDILASLKRELCDQNWRAFAVFSLAVLNSSVGDLDLDILVPYAICAALDKYKLSIEKSLFAVLESSFGEDGFRLLAMRHDQAGGAPKLEKRLSSAQLTPNLAIAVLVGCGVTFAEAANAVREQKALEPSRRLIPPGSRGPRTFYYPKDIADARELATAFGIQAQLRVGRPFVFWLLFLSDRKWLYDWMHEDNPRCATSWDEPPCIEQDRKVVCSKGSRHLRQAARARAYTRDREWLESFDSTRIQPVDRAAVLIDQLRSAKATHYAEVGRPFKWTIASAAKRLRIPHGTLSAFAQRNLVIRELVPESASTYLNRVINWAVAETFTEGEPPTATTVLRFPKLPGEAKVMHQISAAIEGRVSFLGVTRRRSIRKPVG